MRSARQVGVFTAAGAALLAAATFANALMIAPPSLAQRVAQAHTIVVGKVEKLEEKAVSAPRFPGDKEKAEYQIAVIKVEDPILAAKGITHVRVGFVPPPMGGGPGPIRRYPTVNFTKDQEVLVFLNPHFEANFLEATVYYNVIDKKGNANFEKDLAEVKKYAKLLANPKDGLTSKDKDERFTTAAMLVAQYRARRPGVNEPKTEAVDAETSKLILTALAEADWKANTGFNRLSPMMTFQQLGVTEKDGFTPPAREIMGQKQVDFQKYPEAAQQWLKDNAGKYKIQRFVYEEKKDDKKDK
jgi:hypothetical protein